MAETVAYGTYTWPNWIDGLQLEAAVKLILLQITGGTIPSGGSGGGGGGGAAVTVESTAAAANGTVGAGASAISFVTSSDWSGTINGAAFPASASVSLNAPQGRSLPAVAYTRAAGTVYINAMR